MMEMLILAMVAAYVVKNGAVDVIHALNGQTSPRRQAVRARVPSGAATKFFSQLWHDSWDDALTRHNERRAGQRPQPRADKPRSAARVFWSGFGQDARRAARRKWDQGWISLDEKRRSRATRVPDGTDVIPGEVVPEPPVPAEPEPVLRDQPDGGTDLQFGTDPTDPTGTRSCPSCGGVVVVDGEICAACQYRQQQRNQYHDQEQEDGMRDAWHVRFPNGDMAISDDNFYEGRPGYGAVKVRGYDTDHGFRIMHEYPEAPPTQEGTPAMTTMPTTEVVGLDQAINYCEASAVAHREQIVVIERTMAALDAGDVSGPAAGFLAQAMEHNASCQSAMESAAAELTKQKAIQEAYDTVQGAGTREFVTGGR